MNIDLRKIYRGEKADLKVEFDKTSKTRPAWIIVRDAPDDAQFIYVRINEGTSAYYVCWYSTIKIFLPINPTSVELEKYYNKFSKTYDSFVKKKNITEAEVLLGKTALLLPKNAKVLDLGAGTGQSTIPLVISGFDVTLVELSKKMLSIAKKREELKGCMFIQKDVRKLNLNKKFDLLFSINSFACATPYFTEAEMPELYERATKHLKPRGLIAFSGYDFEPPKKLFEKIESGIYMFGGSKHKYFIGRKR